MSRYEEVNTYDDDGSVVYSYVERVVETPEMDEPPDDYYDQEERDDAPVMEPVGDIGFYMSKGGYSDEPPF